MKIETEMSRLQAERDVARHELAQSRQLIAEIRTVIEGPGDADQKINRLIDVLQFEGALA